MLVKEMRSSRALTPSKQFQSIDVYKTALEKFSEGKHIDTGTEQAQNINGVGAESSKSNDPLIDEFLELIGYTGRPYFQWELIKPVFLWKLQVFGTFGFLNKLVFENGNDRQSGVTFSKIFKFPRNDPPAIFWVAEHESDIIFENFSPRVENLLKVRNSANF